MNRSAVFILIVLAAAVGCARSQKASDIAPGTDVRVTERDGTVVAGRLVEVSESSVIVDAPDGTRRAVPRTLVVSMQPASTQTPASGARAAGEAPQPAPSTATATPATTAPSAPPPAWREVTVPAGTVLAIRLEDTVGSDVSRVEDPVRGRLEHAVQSGSATPLPAGTRVTGHVTSVARSGKVKGRASLGLRFDELLVDGERYSIRTRPLAREAPSTRKQDAEKIGIPAAGGAVIGAIIGGKKGAAIGGVVGGGAGTAVVLSTPGQEVRLPAGTVLNVRLVDPIAIRLPVRR